MRGKKPVTEANHSPCSKLSNDVRVQVFLYEMNKTKALKIHCMRHAEHHARNRTSLAGLDQKLVLFRSTLYNLLVP